MELLLKIKHFQLRYIVFLQGHFFDLKVFTCCLVQKRQLKGLHLTIQEIELIGCRQQEIATHYSECYFLCEHSQSPLTDRGQALKFERCVEICALLNDSQPLIIIIPP